MFRFACSFLMAFMLMGGGDARGASFREIYGSVHPSVVVIDTTQRKLASGGSRQMVDRKGLGSGVLISDDGKIITASHVVQIADEVRVRFKSGETVEATVIASEPAADISLLQLRSVPKGSRVASLADSDRVSVGDEVFVIGAPYGISHSLTIGHISSRHRPNVASGGLWLAEFFQTDAAINQGNSGGPMFNMEGEVIGIVSHIFTKSGGFEGLGFAVTSNTARRYLLERPSVWSGMNVQIVSGDLARALNIPGGGGFVVQQVAKGSPAEKFGIRAGTMRASIQGKDLLVGGDVILEIMGIPARDLEHSQRIRERVNGLRDGEILEVKVLREGKVVPIAKKVLRQ